LATATVSVLEQSQVEQRVIALEQRVDHEPDDQQQAD
jgi:hypothetical protein